MSMKELDQRPPQIDLCKECPNKLKPRIPTFFFRKSTLTLLTALFCGTF